MEVKLKNTLPNKSISLAEAKAIDLALDLVEHSDSTGFIIFSDSLSLLPALHKHKLPNSIPTSNLVCIRIASILNSQSCNLKHGVAYSNHCEVGILLMKFLARLKNQVKSLV